jgi:hypothetical protein
MDELTRDQETAKLPDWGKVEFYEYPGKPWEEILKGASSRGRDLTSRLVRYESKSRLSAAEVRNEASLRMDDPDLLFLKALYHPFFSV